LEECGQLSLKSHHKTTVISGFSMLEALLACALMAMGLAASVRLSMVSWHAIQSNKYHDLASAMAQDLGECWGVQTPTCVELFKTNPSIASLPNDTNAYLSSSWQETNISVLGAPLGSLKELRIKVTWLQDGETTERVWIRRRASTPAWVGS
jgi:Tfp pilus assembly protein PilV